MLKRSHAPITDEAWQIIDEQAARTLKTYLSGRTIVDFNGPFGWEYSAVNLGRLELASTKRVEGLSWGTRKVQTLIEIRTPFFLDIMELDCIARGSADPDLAPLDEAAKKVAAFEEYAIYQGYDDGGIAGILTSSSHRALPVKDRSEFPTIVAQGLSRLNLAGIGATYVLVLGTELYQQLVEGECGGYPLRRRVRDVLGDEARIIWSPAVDGGALLSARGGDFELTVGQDISVGYVMHDRKKAEFYFAESFTFRVLEPRAAIEIKRGGKK